MDGVSAYFMFRVLPGSTSISCFGCTKVAILAKKLKYGGEISKDCVSKIGEDWS